MTSIKSIIIIEDHPVMRHGLAAYFEKAGWQVNGTASSLNEARKLFRQVSADIALLDIQLDDGWGLDVITWLQSFLDEKNAIGSQNHPGTQRHSVLPLMAVYSAFEDYAHVSAALSLGVKAYVTKRRSEQELEAALLKALNGNIIIDEAARIKLDNTTNVISLLTKREAELLNLVKTGLSNIQIANQLGISRRTVENILSCVYDKTDIRSRLELERL